MTSLLMLALLVFPGAEGDDPRIVHVGTVAPDVLAIAVDQGRIEHARQVPYVKQDGDQIRKNNHQIDVIRKGRFLGSLVGAKGDILYTLDRVVGARLDTKWSDAPGSYRLASKDDPAFATPVSPTAVHRKSKPTDSARYDAWKWDAPIRHVIYLKLPRPISEGKTYSVSFEGGPFKTREYRHDPARTRSEAVHVSHTGFRPDDPVKVAFVSCWMGGGGPLEYAKPLTFRVLDDRSGASVFSGSVEPSKRKDQKDEDAYKRNYNGTDVFVCRFGKLTKPGRYRVSVEGVGCSYPFEIGPDVWKKAFQVSARGFYHHRSGIELGPPHTDFKRPRCFHPEDGMEILHSDAALMDTGNGLNRQDGNFSVLNKGRTDRKVANAWGGYQDAGDWDRRIQHLRVSRLLLELDELCPEAIAGIGLNLPESKDGLPDAVSEALFNLDHYRRMQTPEGGIRGGVESEEHPRRGEGSWQESLPVMAYAPGVWSSYEYAGVAARAAGVLGKRKSSRAATYRTSALKAMNWAEARLPALKQNPNPAAVRDSRNLAAVELYRLTGEAKWRDIFMQTTFFKDPGALIYKWQSHEQRDAAFVAARVERDEFSAEIRKNARAAILREANDRLGLSHRTGFGWTKDPWAPLGWGTLSSPDAESLVRAHALTGEEKFVAGVIRACQSGLGANPVNLCYTTGLGHDSPKNPLHIDSRVTLQAPPPGITVYGPVLSEKHKDHWIVKAIGHDRWHPAPQHWPTTEAFWDLFWYPSMCEYTVDATMLRSAYAWGYLAGRK